MLSLMKGVFLNNESDVLIQRRFNQHFNVGCHGWVPVQNIVLLWVEHLKGTATTDSSNKTETNRKARICTKLLKTWKEKKRTLRLALTILFCFEHIQPNCQKNSAFYLHFHPYKMIVIHELTPCDREKCQVFTETMLE